MADGTAVAARRKRGQKKSSFLKVFVLTLVIAIIAGTVGIILVDNYLNKPIMDKSNGGLIGVTDPLPVTAENMEILVPASGMYQTEFADSKRVNILLLGNTDEVLTDTIMLLSIDPESKRVDIISVPRDTYYPREGYGASWLKLNAVFKDIKTGKGDPMASCQAVSDILGGCPINYYAVCSYDGVSAIINSMGGVPYDVPMDMDYVSVSQNLYIHLKAGQQVLDGDHAVQYLRFREGYTNGDIGRVQAQQAFVKATIKQAMKINNILPVANAVVNNVDSRITLNNVRYLVQASQGMSMDNVHSTILPGVPQMIGGLSFYMPADSATIQQMMHDIYAPPAPAPAAGSSGASGTTAAQ
ncbi:MAG: LCP family protein [Clostridiales bacterium]|nr:LCP family protein [Clostridiales bacterium]